MNNILKYKDFIGSVSYSSDDDVFYGKLEGLNDLVTFEANSVSALKNAFHEAVLDYLKICKDELSFRFNNFEKIGKRFS